MTNVSPHESWHLDKKVPVSIIAVLVVQLIGFGILWGDINARVKNLEDRQAINTALLAELPQRLARLEALLERIDRQLDKFGGVQ